jgi:hypothetical protein
VFSVALITAALLLASCHGSSKQATATSNTGAPTTDAKGKPVVSVTLKLGSLQVQAAGTALPFNATVAKTVLALMNKYVSRAITHPLFTGQSATGVSAYFSPTLLPRIGPKGVDRAALTDEHEPVITNLTKAVKEPLALVALEDHGRTVMIGAQFGLVMEGSTAQGPLTVSRLGNFVFEPNAHGTWLITGYEISVRRTNGSTTTTQKATTTTAAK